MRRFHYRVMDRKPICDWHELTLVPAYKQYFAPKLLLIPDTCGTNIGDTITVGLENQEYRQLCIVPPLATAHQLAKIRWMSEISPNRPERCALGDGVLYALHPGAGNKALQLRSYRCWQKLDFPDPDPAIEYVFMFERPKYFDHVGVSYARMVYRHI